MFRFVIAVLTFSLLSADVINTPSQQHNLLDSLREHDDSGGKETPREERLDRLETLLAQQGVFLRHQADLLSRQDQLLRVQADRLSQQEQSLATQAQQLARQDSVITQQSQELSSVRDVLRAQSEKTAGPGETPVPPGWCDCSAVTGVVLSERQAAGTVGESAESREAPVPSGDCGPAAESQCGSSGERGRFHPPPVPHPAG